MTELTTSERPSRVAIDLSEGQVVFVRVGDDHYAAELDGRSLRIRSVRHESRIYENGGRDPYEPKLLEGDTANIDTVLRCLALGAVPTPIPRGVEFTATDNWGHFRQNTFLKTWITIAESGILEINENIGEQDDSYY
jgi:hypothetical protein